MLSSLPAISPAHRSSNHGRCGRPASPRRPSITTRRSAAVQTTAPAIWGCPAKDPKRSQTGASCLELLPDRPRACVCRRSHHAHRGGFHQWERRLRCERIERDGAAARVVGTNCLTRRTSDVRGPARCTRGCRAPAGGVPICRSSLRLTRSIVSQECPRNRRTDVTPAPSKGGDRGGGVSSRRDAPPLGVCLPPRLRWSSDAVLPAGRGHVTAGDESAKGLRKRSWRREHSGRGRQGSRDRARTNIARER